MKAIIKYICNKILPLVIAINFRLNSHFFSKFALLFTTHINPPQPHAMASPQRDYKGNITEFKSYFRHVTTTLSIYFQFTVIDF